METHVARIRAATTSFRVLDSAVAASYERHVAHCIEDPPAGMGYHHSKRAPSLGLWYLHVWAWLENPSGVTADFNPHVRC
jgi:hypothetical protein